MSLTILVDMDGIVVNLLSTWLDHYNAELAPDGEQRQVSDITGQIHKSMPKSVGSAIYQYIDRDGWFLGLPPMDGAVQALEQLVKDGHNVVICTAPSDNPQSAADKFTWIKKHLHFLPRKNVVITKSKHLVSGDVLIDDTPLKQAEWLMTHPKGTVMQINWPYNEDSLAHVKADDWANSHEAWQTILAAIAKLSKKAA